MKKILGFLSLLFIVFVTQAQTPVTRSQTVQATQDLLPPLDTVLAPIRSGEIRFKPSDSTFYGSTSTTSPKMWWPLSTSYTLPFGSSTLTNLSIDANGRIVSATQGVLPYAPLPINIFANGNGQVANGAEGDYVYIKGNGVPDTLKHFYNKVTARDTLWVRYSLDGGYTWSTAVKATLHLWFPQVEFYPATGLYYATGTTSAEKNVWLYNSSDGINWSALNSGNPVLSASTDTTNYAYSLVNTGFVIIRTNGVDIIHYLCEGSAKQAQTGVTAGGGYYANGPYSGYVNAPLSSPAAILPLKPQLKGGNTKLFYIPEHNAILTMYGYYTGIFPDYSQNWVIRFAKTSLNNNLQDSSSWIPIKKQWNLGNTADPSIGFLGNNDSAIVYYEYNQGSSGNQAYMPHIRTPLQLYEGMVDSAYQFNVLNNTAQRVTTATGLGDRINAEANLTFDGTTLTTPYGRIKNNLYFGNSSTTEYISPDGLGSLYSVANSNVIFGPGGSEKARIAGAGQLLVGTTSPIGAEKARVFGKLAVDTLATGASGTDSIVVWNSVSKDFRKIAPGSGGGTTTYFINSKLGDTTFRTTGPGLAANTIQWKGLIPGNGMNSVTTDSTIKYNWGGTLAQATTINNNGFGITYSGTGTIAISGGNYNGSLGCTWQMNGATINNAVTAASGTVAKVAQASIGGSTWTASNTGVTYTNAATFYVDGPPTAGTNVTITNPYTLYVNGGNSWFGGNVFAPALIGGTASTGNLTLQSTSNNTKGSINFGTSQYSESANFLQIQTNNIGSTITSSTGTWLQNSTAATSTQTQISPALTWEGQGWKTNATAGSQRVQFFSWVVPSTGAASPVGTWYLQSSINGAANAPGIQVGSDATLGVYRIQGITAGVPTITAGAAAGTGSTSSIVTTSSDLSGQFNFTTGTGTTASGIVLTVNFNKVQATNTPFVILYPINAAAAALTGTGAVFISSSSSTSFNISVGSTALAASTQYSWNYHVFQ